MKNQELEKAFVILVLTAILLPIACGVVALAILYPEFFGLAAIITIVGLGVGIVMWLRKA